MSCHFCDITALGCSGCDARHAGYTTHGNLFLGFGSPLLSSKTILHEFGLHLSGRLLAEDSKHKAGIDNSLLEGPLGKVSRCALSAAIQQFALKTSEQLGQEILPALEKILRDDEDAKKQARAKAEEAAIRRARTIAEDTARETAAKIANDLAPKAASQAAVKPATDKATEIANQKMKEIEIKFALDKFVNDELSWIKNVPQEEIQRRILRAAENAPAVTQTFEIPPNLATQVPRLALYDFLVLCDDSGSMNSDKDERKRTQESTVRGLFQILKQLGSDRLFSIIPFEGRQTDNPPDQSAVDQALEALQYKSHVNALDGLNNRILPRLEGLMGKQDLSPTVVVVITDGDVGDVGKFGNRIALFKSYLNQHHISGPAVLFLICRVGGSSSAAESLSKLKNNSSIADMILYSEDRLDSKLASMQGNLNAYTGYVVGELLKAMELQLIKR